MKIMNSKLLPATLLILIVGGTLAVDVLGQTLPRGIDHLSPKQRPVYNAPSRPSSMDRPSAPGMAPERLAAIPGQKATVGVCGNPKVACKTDYTFQPFDLPFRVPNTAVLYETELFYAVILKSKPAPNDNCDIFFSETERLTIQELFPERKVFASRCADPEYLYYTNTKRDHRILAVYAGKTLAEANRTLAAVKATKKFAGANIRRMRTGFNGT